MMRANNGLLRKNNYFWSWRDYCSYFMLTDTRARHSLKKGRKSILDFFVNFINLRAQDPTHTTNTTSL